jgi:putative transposase
MVDRLNGRLIELNRFKTPSRKTLTHRTWIKRVQRRYSRSWRFIRGVKELSRSQKGVRSVSWDYSRK